MMNRCKVIVGFLRIFLVCLVLICTLGAVAGTAYAASLLPAPTLSSPSNGATGVSTTPIFSWSSVPGANYYWLTVATNPGYLPTDPNATSAPNCVIGSNGVGISATSYQPSSPLSTGVTYYWKVQTYHGSDALHPDQQGNYSSQWQFTTAPAVTLPPAPTITSPGSSSSPGPTISTLTPSFQWSGVSGADYYGLYIRDLASNSLVFDSQARGIQIAGSSYTLPSGVLEWSKPYRWNMNSHNSAGWGTSYSGLLYFQTQAQVQLPTIGYSLSSFTFTATQGGANPSSQTLSIWNLGGGTLNWSVSDDAAWLTLSPTNGTSTGEIDSVVVSVIISGMSAGSYSATITISASGASNTPRTIPVSLTISQAQETIITPNTPVGSTSGQVNQSLTYSTSGASSSLGHSFEYRFDWGDGSYSSWSSSTTASHSWSTQGTYTVRAQARCATHTSVVSNWSSGLSVSIASPTGTINVTSNPSGVSFSLSGPASYSGMTPWSTSNALAGTYTITWGAMTGYTMPPSETKTLTQGGTISFYGPYQSAYTDQVYWLAKVILSEASIGNQTERICVGQTLLNRLRDGRYGENVEKVAKGQGNLNGGFAWNQGPGTLSEEQVWLESQNSYIKSVWSDIKTLAQELLDGKHSDPTGGALYFFSPCSMQKGYGPYEIPGTGKRALIPDWAIPEGYSKASPPPSDWKMVDFYVTIPYSASGKLEWVGGLNNVQNDYFMFYRPLRTVPDTTPPSISISYPSSGQTFSNPIITFTGTAFGDVAVSKVEVRVGSGSWQTASGTNSWSIQVTLNPGSNTVYARVLDTSGNFSGETSVTVNYEASLGTEPPQTISERVQQILDTIRRLFGFK